MYKKLIEDHKRLIESEAAKHSAFIPGNVVQAEAYRLAHDAAHSFDPKSGNKFSTHLTNQLKKLSRLSTQYGNAVRVPENKQFKISRLNHAEKALKSELNRDPSVHELADALGTSLNDVRNLLQYRKKEVAASNLIETPIFINNENDDWLHFVYHDLAPRDKIIFEHKVGFAGAADLDNDAIAKKLKVSSATVANRVNFITEKIKEGWQHDI